MDRKILSLLAKTLLEKIVRYCTIPNLVNKDKILKDNKAIVELACGHYAYVRAVNRARCPRCQEMFRRSIMDGEEDYMSVRDGILPDQMEWAGDPCRQYNESERNMTNESKVREGE